MTVLEMISASLRELNVLAEGEVPTTDQANDGLDSLNDLIDSWAAERLMVYKETRTVTNITASDGSYTIGSGGDINIAWPVYIDHVNYQDTSVSPTIEYQMQPLTDDAWSKLPQRSLTAPMPTSWYVDRSFPQAVLYLFPVPTLSTLQTVLYTGTAVPEFTALTDSISLPPGYRKMIRTNLAVDLAPGYGREVPPTLYEEASRSKGVVQSANVRMMDLSVDQGALVQGAGGTYWYNIYVGP